ncbi:hypothetical protein PFICI_12306 [Pestalotiopsis fici W106-1]|uniref:Xylanolytic transcriptional activator regulatory domain-containing protein n=1 Tax=Pestalotiopsis fici (strain W106-1 / CGMCC3.15140) TaxID=1229662 RepID=W3WQE6_PESFW|nr:uncharacterized protein PFICI_12306 [Pestalotiopsis fici W106-1]ETS75362.1 hypothetical protein PFICI_12306 [Pestalotiopsis fici W106-1]
MSVFAFRFGLEKCSSILAEAVSLAQSLRLHLDFILQGKESGISTIQVKRATWFLFVIDKRYALRWQTFPLLPELDYDLPRSEKRRHTSRSSQSDTGTNGYEEDWLCYQCSYAQICVRITKGSFLSATCSNSASKEKVRRDMVREESQPLSDEMQNATINNLLADLQDWFKSVQFITHSRADAEGEASIQECQMLLKISAAYQYYEALLSVLSPLVMNKSRARYHDQSNQKDQTATEMLMQTVRSVLEMGTHLSQITYDRTLLHVPTMALCLLAIEKADGNSELDAKKRDGRVLIAMAYGLFGRLAETLPHHKFFEHVADLVSMVDRV